LGTNLDIAGLKDTPEERAKLLDRVPLRRFCSNNDIANTVVFLASEESSFITGVQIPVDGGRCLD
jgi:3-oxoacyl-[acyl-carrier protein] reductase